MESTVSNRDILFDGVTIHDMFRRAPAHNACLGGMDSIIGITIRNSKFYNCDTQGVFFSYTVQSTSVPNTVTNVLFENNWIAAPTDNGGSVPCACSQSLAIKATSGTESDWVIRNNVIFGNTGWSTDTANPVVASNIVMTGNLFENISGLGGWKSPTSGVIYEYNRYQSLDGSSLPGVGNVSGTLPVVANPSPPNEANLNYDITAASAPENFVPASAYAVPSAFTTAFGLYDPAAVLSADIHGNSRPCATSYTAGAQEKCG
ncbi:MAG: hypothetical protein ACHQDE_05960 [Acidimicrobiia bacterium]